MATAVLDALCLYLGRRDESKAVSKEIQAVLCLVHSPVNTDNHVDQT